MTNRVCCPHHRVLLVFLALIVSTIGTDSAHAQGSATDYERARTLPQQLRGLVRNATIDARWLDDTRLFYRLDGDDGGRTYRLVDVSTGAKERAFDHERLARALSEALGRAVDAAQLPVAFATWHDDALVVVVRPEWRAFRIDASDGGATEIELAAIDDFGLAPTRGRRSRDDGGESAIVIVNRRTTPVEFVWLDRDGNARSYGMVTAGGQRSQHTFAGHLWQLRDGATVLGTYRATRSPGVVIATDDLPAPAPNRRRAPRARDDGGSSSPWRATIVDRNVRLTHRENGEIVALSTDGSADDHYTGRMQWSPDGTRLLVIREVPAQSHTVSFIESAPRDQTQPKLHQFDYLKPGDRIAQPRVVLFDVEARRVLPVTHELAPTPWSIGRVHWAPDSSEVYYHYNQRGHQVVRVLAVDARTGATRVVVEDAPETFVDYSQKTYLHHLDDANALIWMSERSGWNHLYRVDRATGSATPITRGDWVVRAVDHVDETAGTIRFRAMGVFPEQDPYHEHIGRVNLDGSGLTWLTRGDGTHAIEDAPDGAHYIDTYSRVDLAPVHELRRTADGALITELARADARDLTARVPYPPERFVAKGRDGTTDIWGVIFTPSTFDPAQSYPVIEQIYAGPHGHFVPKSFRAWHGAQAMAELGFVVVQIDGMGTNWRSKAFHDVCWQNLGDSGFADRIAWMNAAAATRPWMDLSRVGIYGGSAGGQSAVRAMLAHGDVYHAAVADCGCHDNRMDKIWWNEAWMGWPIGEHYAEQSNVTNAHRLTGALLLVVGELDRNVDPASTMQVVDALIRADKDFDLLVIPGAGHGAAESPYGRRRRADFFVRELLGREPRWAPE